MDVPEGAIPIDQFQAADEPQSESGLVPADAIPIDQFKAADEGGNPSSMFASEVRAAPGLLESGVKGLAGHTLTALAEKGLSKLGVPGMTPEDQAAREETLKSEMGEYAPAVGEAAGFGAGMFTGASEAAMLGKVGEATLGLTGLAKVGKAIQATKELQAAGKLGPLLQTPSVSARLAAGAVKSASELAAMQADNETAKAINGTSKGIGDALTNIGLNAALGGAAGGAFTGSGMLAKPFLGGLVDFLDQSAARGAGISPNEMAEKQFSDAHQAMSNMGTEVGGANGVIAQARSKLMPELHDGMTAQAQDLYSQIGKTAEALQKNGDNSGSLGELRAQAEKIRQAIDTGYDPLMGQATKTLNPGEIFDTLNGVKRQLGEWADFNKDMVPLSEVGFRNASKKLGFEFKTALENPDVWGKVGDLQKSMNSAWSDSFGALKDARAKFMQKVMGQYNLDPAKFATYLKQNSKTTSQSIRQQMMQNFVDSVEKFQTATTDAYAKAGVENPHTPVALGSLKESYGKQSAGYKLANAMHDTLSAPALGNLAGEMIGGAAAQAMGRPGIEGVYAGRWTLGGPLGAVIKPIMDKGYNLKAVQGTLKFARAAAAGQQKLVNATNALFSSGAKTIPTHLIPDTKQLLKLDNRLKEKHDDQASLLDSAGDLPHYLPDHAQMMTRTAMNAVNTLNAARPSNPKTGIFDAEIPPSKAQESDYQRKLAIAEQPLMVLHHIDQGTLLPSDVQTLQQLYPEHYEKMKQQVMVSMMDHAQDGGTVPYTLRQGLSLFLGQPLDSTFLPQSIQAIQSSYAQNASQPPQGGGKPKGSPSKLGKVATNMQTPMQAREARQDHA